MYPNRFLQYWAYQWAYQWAYYWAVPSPLSGDQQQPEEGSREGAESEMKKQSLSIEKLQVNQLVEVE